jgi:hypothetical protein
MMHELNLEEEAANYFGGPSVDTVFRTELWSQNVGGINLDFICDRFCDCTTNLETSDASSYKHKGDRAKQLYWALPMVAEGM